MAFIVLLDACVLVNAAVRDTILRAAQSEQFRFRLAFSEDILKEARKALVDAIGVTPEQSDYFVSELTAAFEESLVEGYEKLIPAMQNDPKDRHVLAAAVYVGAGVIVTSNLTHFPDEACEPYDIQVKKPDEFLLDLWDLNPEFMLALLHQQAAELKKPAMSFEDLLSRLEQDVPTLVGRVRGLGPYS